MISPGPGIIRCDRGDPLPAPAELREVGARAMREHTGYVDPLGRLELRGAISRHLRAQIGVTYDPQTEVVVTAGASPALATALLSLTAPGDEVLVPDPGWPHYLRLVESLGRVPRTYSSRPFRPAAGVGRAPRALVLNTPHNPTGAVLTREELGQLEALCTSLPGFTVLSDETYDTVVFDGAHHLSPASLPALAASTVVVRTFSKTFAVPGWRVGYLAAREPRASLLRRLHTGLGSFASTPAQVAATWMLEHGQGLAARLRDDYALARDLLVPRLSSLPGFSVAAPQGTPYLFPAVGRSGRDTADLLALRHGVHLHPGELFGPGGAGHVRISLALRPDTVSELADRLARFAQERC